MLHISERKINIEFRIKRYRNLLDLSQDELAKLVGCTRQTINAIEKGKYSPSLLLAFKIADVLNADINDVFEYKKK
ncbi:helix-turn-helix transcriptional regulator [Candidatus Izimoplasma sp. ZiA1]|uniref:helix-turn-helix transcriptional regulator n=1 Tax=Candidatus Izimoplasma sp. ZiA1 TaxID=2024899 RepID=UPI003F592C4E